MSAKPALVSRFDLLYGEAAVEGIQQRYDARRLERKHLEYTEGNDGRHERGNVGAGRRKRLNFLPA
jgi:hypothetical protein